MKKSKNAMDDLEVALRDMAVQIKKLGPAPAPKDIAEARAVAKRASALLRAEQAALIQAKRDKSERAKLT